MWDEVLTLLKTKTPTLSSRGRISLPPEVWDLLQAIPQNIDRRKTFVHRQIYIRRDHVENTEKYRR